MQTKASLNINPVWLRTLLEMHAPSPLSSHAVIIRTLRTAWTLEHLRAVLIRLTSSSSPLQVLPSQTVFLSNPCVLCACGLWCQASCNIIALCECLQEKQMIQLQLSAKKKSYTYRCWNNAVHYHRTWRVLQSKRHCEMRALIMPNSSIALGNNLSITTSLWYSQSNYSHTVTSTWQPRQHKSL